MTTLLILLSLLATECKVHRLPYPQSGCTFNLSGSAVCQDASHWFPCTVVEKCDTVVIWEATANKFLKVACDSVRMRTYRLENCHAETTLVDSGVNVIRFDSATICTVKIHPAYGRLMESMFNPPDSASIPQFLDSAELADLREMPKKLKALSQEIRALRRQIDFRTCLDTLKLRQNGQWYTDPKRPDTTWVTMGMPTVRDSCGCLYGRTK